MKEFGAKQASMRKPHRDKLKELQVGCMIIIIRSTSMWSDEQMREQAQMNIDIEDANHDELSNVCWLHVANREDDCMRRGYRLKEELKEEAKANGKKE